MKRRQAVAAKNKSSKNRHVPEVVTNAEHPGHAKWVASVRKAAKKRWAKMSLKERKAKLEKMQAGRAAKKKHVPTVHLAEAS